MQIIFKNIYFYFTTQFVNTLFINTLAHIFFYYKLQFTHYYYYLVICCATISDRSTTLQRAARAMLLLHNGHEVTMRLHCVASSSRVIRSAMRCCCESLITVFASEPPQHSASRRLCSGSTSRPTDSITRRGSS